MQSHEASGSTWQTRLRRRYTSQQRKHRYLWLQSRYTNINTSVARILVLLQFHDEGQSNVIPVLGTKAQMASGGAAPVILNLSTRWKWMVSFTPWPFDPEGKSPGYPMNRRLRGPQSPNGHSGEEINPLHVVRDTNRESYSTQSGHYTDWAIRAHRVVWRSENMFQDDDTVRVCGFKNNFFS